MLGSKCCCGQTCGTGKQTGSGVSVSIRTFDYPVPSKGNIVFKYKTEDGGLVDIFVYISSNWYFIELHDVDTNGETETVVYENKYHDFDELTVKIVSKTSGSWEYEIGCPENECLIVSCPETNTTLPTPVLETITLTLDVPSYKLTIPRVGAEFWYHYWEPYGPQFLPDGSVNPRNPDGEYVNKIPLTLPLDFKIPQLKETVSYRFFDKDNNPGGEVRTWNLGEVNYRNQDNVGIQRRPPSPGEYVRPDELLGGWLNDVYIIYPTEDYEGSVITRPGLSAGVWELVGKIEFEAYWELDGDAWSGTYELQKTVSEDGTVGWLYYFDDGPPSCNEISDDELSIDYSSERYPPSFIYVEGCNLFLGNLKVKVSYDPFGVLGDPECPTKYNNLDGFSGYAILSMSKTINHNPMADYDIPPCRNPDASKWSIVPDRSDGINFGSQIDSELPNFPMTQDIHVVSLVDNSTDDASCFGDVDGLFSIREQCTYDSRYIDEDCNTTCASIISPYNGYAQAYWFNEDENNVTDFINFGASPSYEYATVYQMGTDRYGVKNVLNSSYFFYDEVPQITPWVPSVFTWERNVIRATGEGVWQFIDPDFYNNSVVWSRTTDTSPAYRSFWIVGREEPRNPIGLPWLPNWLWDVDYPRNADGRVELEDFFRPFSPYDPYREETGYSWDPRCVRDNLYYDEGPLGPNEWMCGKCGTQWYVDQGYWIEEGPTRAWGEIFITDITPKYEGEDE